MSISKDSRLYKILRTVYRICIKDRDKEFYIRQFKKGDMVLDVGCGNNSPIMTKNIAGDIYYVGVDIGDYNNAKESIEQADEYILSTPEDFYKTIRSIDHLFDYAIWSHNIEHCNYPMETLDAICDRLKPGGKLYLSCPSEKSVKLPHRKGTLNFYDDPSHIYLPIFKDIISRFNDNGMKIIFAAKQYRTVKLIILGLINEIKSRKQDKVLVGTWALWGFETLIWAEKKK